MDTFFWMTRYLVTFYAAQLEINIDFQRLNTVEILFEWRRFTGIKDPVHN